MNGFVKWLNRTAGAVHVYLYRQTDGKMGGKTFGNPTMLVTTVGRKTGKTRVTPVVYVEDGDRLIVLASAAGAPKHPGWYWNAISGSAPVTVQIGAKEMVVDVVEVKGEEREPLYAKYKQAVGVEQIEGYEKKAPHLVFPVLLMTPQ